MVGNVSGCFELAVAQFGILVNMPPLGNYLRFQLSRHLLGLGVVSLGVQAGDQDE